MYTTDITNTEYTGVGYKINKINILRIGEEVVLASTNCWDISVKAIAVDTVEITYNSIIGLSEHIIEKIDVTDKQRAKASILGVCPFNWEKSKFKERIHKVGFDNFNILWMLVNWINDNNRNWSDIDNFIEVPIEDSKTGFMSILYCIFDNYIPDAHMPQPDTPYDIACKLLDDDKVEYFNILNKCFIHFK